MSGESVVLTVDGEEVPLIDTIRLLQRDPFPGGHRYRLVVPALSGVEPSTTPAREIQQATMWAIEGLVANLPGEPTNPARYILNSVDVIKKLDSGLQIEGECSTPVEET